MNHAEGVSLTETENYAPAPLPDAPGMVTHLAFSGDGKFVAAAGQPNADFGLVVWDVETRERVFAQTDSVSALCLSYDGSRLAVVRAGEVSLWDTFKDSERPTISFAGPEPQKSAYIAINDAGSMLAWGAGRTLSTCHLFDGAWHQDAALEVPGNLQSLALSKTGSVAATSDDRGNIIAWNPRFMSGLPNARRLSKSTLAQSSRPLAMSSDAKWFLAGTPSGVVDLYCLAGTINQGRIARFTDQLKRALGSFTY